MHAHLLCKQRVESDSEKQVFVCLSVSGQCLLSPPTCFVFACCWYVPLMLLSLKLPADKLTIWSASPSSNSLSLFRSFDDKSSRKLEPSCKCKKREERFRRMWDQTREDAQNIKQIAVNLYFSLAKSELPKSFLWLKFPDMTCNRFSINKTYFKPEWENFQLFFWNLVLMFCWFSNKPTIDLFTFNC